MARFSLFFKLIQLEWVTKRKQIHLSASCILRQLWALTFDSSGMQSGEIQSLPFCLSLPVDSVLCSPWEGLRVVSWSQLRMRFEKSPSERILLVTELLFSSSWPGPFHLCISLFVFLLVPTPEYLLAYEIASSDLSTDTGGIKKVWVTILS